MPANNQVRIPHITIGCDPELFLKNTKTGKYVSAHDLLPGTKEKPHKVEFGAIQVDGTAAEFNTTPAEDAPHFVHYVKNVLKQLKDRLPDHTLCFEPSITYDEEYFKSLPLKTKDLGCNPDFNAWERRQNDAPDPSSCPTMRTASGHIHIGWNEGGKPFDVNSTEHFEDCCVVARQMDYYLGIWSLAWDPSPDRRKLYGKAGCFRPKPYGMEYRTLSNKWLMSHDLMAYVWNQTYSGMAQLFKGVRPEEEFEDAAKRIIDEGITDWWTRKEYLKLAKMFVAPPVRLPEPEKKNAIEVTKKKLPNHYFNKKKMTLEDHVRDIGLNPGIWDMLTIGGQPVPFPVRAVNE